MAAHPQHASPTLPALDSPAASAAALRTFFNISKAWALTATEEQRLLGVQRSTVYAWRAGDHPARLDADTLERLSYVFGIYSALQVLFPVAERADAWIRKPNTAPLFGGRSALERMLGGQVADLFEVRRYLDAVRGGVS
ncbi:antitoxin Xre/MbcA/ParS toxin-binding domain-containing protein [Piscinibacter sp. XHJ-5]|uniref:MbcA/ParS/Xre antitoxin family protein n=1 Tax=Piscinibacter sp. XHJ-5 TaxID=3037797 RepID=UPI002452BD86|nr:antitoxin Xre/MbcA/ParS toxin-binding domain-containing protein [Piscinibacter sp. XHJ-5]